MVIQTLDQLRDALETVSLRGLTVRQCAGMMYGVLERLRNNGFKQVAVSRLLVNMGVITGNYYRFLKLGQQNCTDKYAFEKFYGMIMNEPFREPRKPFHEPEPVRIHESIAEEAVRNEAEDQKTKIAAMLAKRRAEAFGKMR